MGRRNRGRSGVRVVGGRFRGLRLETQSGLQVRPTADRAKEALFSMLAPRLYGARVVDCFAGTGALGIEALSRGAAEVVFVERNRESLALLRRNLERLPEGGGAVIPGDALRPADWAVRAFPADIVLADPPFRSGFAMAFLEALSGVDCLAEEGLLVVEHEPGVTLTHPDWDTTRQRRYGEIVFTFLGRIRTRERG